MSHLCLLQLSKGSCGTTQCSTLSMPSRPCAVAVLVRELRNEVARLLAAKVADASLDLSASKVVEAMHHLLASDGF